MGNKAVTLTVTTSSAVYTMPDDNADWFKLRNLDLANGFWIQHDSTILSAAAEAVNCEYVGPGESILVPYRPTYYMIGVGTVKVNVVLALGRL
jgi:hypothetical protein